MQFEIGDGASIRLDTLLSTRLMAQANSGGGKSWLLRRLLEQTHGRVQQFVIDPEGEFATLRQKFDYVLAAKNGGDTLAEPRAAKLLAERLLQLRVSAILDIQELKPTERIEFVKIFLESLIDAPKTLWRHALVVIDEAHVFCPQGGDAASSLAVRDLCARGRKRGYCAVLATQRISKLHKDAVAECNNKLIGRASLDVDMKRCADELGFDKGRMYELRKLEPGEFFAYGPALSDIPTHIRIGPVVTQHPKIGSRRLRVTLPPPTQKIKEMLPRLSDLPAEAEQVATTTKQLRQRVAELTNQLREARQAAPKTVREVERVKVPAVTPRQMRELRELVKQFDRSTRALAGQTSTLAKLLNQADGAVAPIAGALDAAARGPRVTGAAALAASSTQGYEQLKTPNAAPPKEATGLSQPERRILDSLAWFEAIGVTQPEQPAVSFMAGYTYGSGAYNNPRGQLRKKGLIEYHSGNRMSLTASGRATANYPPSHETATAEQLHKSVLARLPGPEQRLLKPLIECWPNALDQRELAEKANYAPNSGAFNNPRGRLRTLGLIEIPSPGKVVARDLLFPLHGQ